MKQISAKEFDAKVESGENIDEYLDFDNAVRLKDFNKNSVKTKKVNVDFPENIVAMLDYEAQKIGVTRQSIIKVWIAERLKQEQSFPHYQAPA
jgi:macrodomain Ter protein organizer (MatP/YcbG family)